MYVSRMISAIILFIVIRRMSNSTEKFRTT